MPLWLVICGCVALIAARTLELPPTDPRIAGRKLIIVRLIMAMAVVWFAIVRAMLFG